MAPNCPVCLSRLNSSTPPQGGDGRYECANCGVYRLSSTAESLLRHEEDEGRRAKLSYAIRRAQRAEEPPLLVTSPWMSAVLESTQLPRAPEEIDNLLLHLAAVLREPGDTVNLDPRFLRAVIGAIRTDSAGWVLRASLALDLIEGHASSGLGEPTSVLNATLTPRGWARVREIQTAAAGSRRAFMAMQFNDPELDRVFMNAFKPAARRAGFELMRVDEEPRAGLIDDHMRVEIRRARFVVADLTHGNRGAYWEAGYAEGLGRPVIYTCHADAFADPARRPHFDTNHHLMIPWRPEALEEAAARLTMTIRVTLPGEAKLDDE